MAQNPAFEKALSAYDEWQGEKTGTFSWDAGVGSGSAKAVKIKSGALIQRIPVKSGDMLAVEADARCKGGTASLSIRWLNTESKWTCEQGKREFAFIKGDGEWSRAFGIVKVPEGAAMVSVMLVIKGQTVDTDICWFDNFGVYNLDDIVR